MEGVKTVKNKMITVLLAMITAFSLCACGAEKEMDKLLIVTTLFPQYDFARQIAGDKAEVRLLLTPGSESHSYEPTAADIASIQQADLFIYNGGESEVWVNEILDSYGIKDNSLRLMDFVSPLKDEDEDEYDEHIFTSLKNSCLLLDGIRDRLCEIDSSNSETYKKNGADYRDKLEKLDADFEKMVGSAKRKTVIVGDRNPFRYLAEDYGLDFHAAFSGCSSESEASPAVLSQLISLVGEDSVPIVFHIEFSGEKVAKKIADATGTKTALLHSCHNVSKEDMENNITYLDLQQQNFNILSEALN